MENLEFLQNFSIPVVMVMCLAVGYILKHWVKEADNRIIPTVLAVLGAVCACVNSQSVSLEIIASGLITGLASTGFHQVFKQWIEKSGGA